MAERENREAGYSEGGEHDLALGLSELTGHNRVNPDEGRHHE